MIATTQDEIQNLRTAGKILAEVLQELAKMVQPGISTAELDLAAEKMIRERGAIPAFLGYKPEGAAYPFPATLCVSINDEVVHGIPLESTLLQEGDLVMLDLGLSYNGYFSDAAITVIAGEGNPSDKKLIAATQEAFAEALTVAKPGNTMGHIGAAIEKVAYKYGFAVVEELGGHSLGKTPHEKPFVPNTGRPGQGDKIVAGMVLAIEPIFTDGKGDIYLADDEWTYKTVDGSRSAETENTVLITDIGAEILTQG